MLVAFAQCGSATTNSTFSVLGGPHYDSVEGLALSVVGAASFRLNGCDSLSQLSNAQFTATYTTNNFWSLDLTTNMLFPNESRLMTTVDSPICRRPLVYFGRKP